MLSEDFNETFQSCHISVSVLQASEFSAVDLLNKVVWMTLLIWENSSYIRSSHKRLGRNDHFRCLSLARCFLSGLVACKISESVLCSVTSLYAWRSNFSFGQIAVLICFIGTEKVCGPPLTHNYGMRGSVGRFFFATLKYSRIVALAVELVREHQSQCQKW